MVGSSIKHDHDRGGRGAQALEEATFLRPVLEFLSAPKNEYEDPLALALDSLIEIVDHPDFRALDPKAPERIHALSVIDFITGAFDEGASKLHADKIARLKKLLTPQP